MAAALSVAAGRAVELTGQRTVIALREVGRRPLGRATVGRVGFVVLFGAVAVVLTIPANATATPDGRRSSSTGSIPVAYKRVGYLP